MVVVFLLAQIFMKYSPTLVYKAREGRQQKDQQIALASR